ncbi:MAG: SDR family NAD(P)-dependent oxidoreductase [Nocardioides sp.]
MKTVAGRRVLITGGAQGMGRLFAERAVREDAECVVLWDIDPAALDHTLADLTSRGGHVRADTVDVSDREAIATAAAAVRDELGGVDVLLNNAGVVHGNHYFWETDTERDTVSTIEINSLGPMAVAREFLPGMIESDHEARLVNIASAAGLTANPRMAAYAASKWAVVGWSESVRLELQQAGFDHVKVTTVCPYYVKTGMFEGAHAALLLPLLEPDDVVTETWKAMVRGRPFLVMPKTVMLSETFKGIMPIGLRDFVADKVIGVYHTMDDFVGHGDDES